MKGRGWKKKRKMKYLILESNLYEPSFAEEKTVTSREKLNKFLISKDISPIRHSIETPWEEASSFITPRQRRERKIC